MQHSVSNVDRDDVGGTAPQKAVCETPGRRSGVETALTVDCDRETLQRGVKLVPASGHEATNLRVDDDRFGLCHESSRRTCHRAPDEHQATFDELHRLVAGRGEATPHELGI
jgi:hypothetical protein